jgi:hypothetical protein
MAARPGVGKYFPVATPDRLRNLVRHKRLA